MPAAGNSSPTAAIARARPRHAPVFVLTHPAREPGEMAGGTSFHFLEAGFEAALEQARAAASDGTVDIAGGASTVRQALAAGAIDELVLHIVPALLGAGERLFDGVADPGFRPVHVIHSPYATHVRYRVDHEPALIRLGVRHGGRVPGSAPIGDRSADAGIALEGDGFPLSGRHGYDPGLLPGEKVAG